METVRWTLLSMFLALFLSSCGSASVEEIQAQQLTELQARITQLSNEKENLRVELAEAQVRITSLTSQNSELRTAIQGGRETDEMRRAFEAREKGLDEREESLNTRAQMLDERERELSEQETAFMARLIESQAKNERTANLWLIGFAVVLVSIIFTVIGTTIYMIRQRAEEFKTIRRENELVWQTQTPTYLERNQIASREKVSTAEPIESNFREVNRENSNN